MSRSSRGLSNTASALTDVALIVISMAAAYLIRFPLLGGDDPVFSLKVHMLWAAALSPVLVLLYSLAGMYNYHPSTSTVRTVGRVVLSDTIGVLLLTAIMYLSYLFNFSRLLLVLFWLVLCVLTSTKAILVDRGVERRHRAGLGRRRILVVGSGEAAQAYVDAVSSDPSCAYLPMGSVGEKPLRGVLHLGGYADTERAVDSTAPDEVVVALQPYEYSHMDTVLLQSEASGADIFMVPAYRSYLSDNPAIFQEAGVPLIGVNHIPLANTGYAFVKRAFDLVASLALIVILSPLMLAAAIGTRLSSPGPVIFTQERVGRGRRRFKIYKFRSMRMNADSDTAWSTHDDPRRTRFGSFMRKYSIDELPQLFNVVRGDMSLVGPRPEIPTYVNEFKQNIPLYMVRHRVRPGITGWAQINGLRGDTPIDKRVEYDLFYIEHWSLTFDLRILLMTPFKGIVNHSE